MKTFLTLFFIIFIGTASQAKDTKIKVKVATITMDIAIPTKEISTPNENGVARLYRHKNALVKKELSFTTKNNRAKFIITPILRTINL